MTETIVAHSLLTSLTFTLLHFLWQGTVIAVVLKSLLLLIPHHRPQLRYLASCGALLTSIIIACLTFVILYQPSSDGQNAQQLASVINAIPDNIVSPVEQTYQAYAEFLPWLSVMWMVSICFLSLRLIVDFFRVSNLSNTDYLQPEPWLQQRFDNLVAQISLTAKPVLRISLKATVPMAVGWMKPVVLLPASMVTGLSNDQLEMLLLHELAHVKRFDYLVNILQTLVEIVLFFHPCVKWISKQIRIEREHCSDDVAIHHCGNPIAYAHTLTDTAVICRHNIPTMAMAASGGDLKQRVVRIVNHHCSAAKSSSSFYAGAFVVFTIAFTAVKQLMSLPVIEVTTASIQFLNPPITETTLDKAELLSQKILHISNGMSGEISKITTTEEVAPKPKEIQHNIAATNVEPIAQLAKQKHVQQAQVNEAQIASTLDNLSQLTRAQENPVVLPEVSVEKPKDKQRLTTAAKTNNSSENNINKQAIKVELETIEATPEMDVAIDKTILNFNQNIIDSTNKLEAMSNKKQWFELASAAELASSMSITEEVDSPKHKAAKIIKSYQPKYPEMAKRRGLETDIRVSFTVNELGEVTNLDFQSANNINYFKRSVRAAMKKWRFKPAVKNGKPVKSTVTKIFSFSLVS